MHRGFQQAHALQGELAFWARGRCSGRAVLKCSGEWREDCRTDTNFPSPLHALSLRAQRCVPIPPPPTTPRGQQAATRKGQEEWDRGFNRTTEEMVPHQALLGGLELQGSCCHAVDWTKTNSGKHGSETGQDTHDLINGTEGGGSTKT